jgi:hypothetical protein
MANWVNTCLNSKIPSKSNQEFGFDINEKTIGTEKTPLMFAMESTGPEVTLVYFLQQVCDESENLGRPVNLNLKNRSKQTVPW